MSRKLLLVGIFFVLILGSVFLPKSVHADSVRAYQDYLYQFDQYRQRNAEFEIAKNEYLKFKTLTSENDALEKTRALLTQRAQLLRAYLLLLNEKLNESVHMIPTDKQVYQTMINNEVSFLDSHSLLIPSVGSIEDAIEVSNHLQDHYVILQKTIRQTIGGLTIAELSGLAEDYDAILVSSKNLINSSSGGFTLEKQAVIDRWVLQITNKRTLYQQKITQIKASNSELGASNVNKIDDIDERFTEIQRMAADARQELIEGNSFMGELVTALRYRD